MCSRISFVRLTWLLFGFKFCLTHCGAGALLPHFGFVRGCLPAAMPRAAGGDSLDPRAAAGRVRGRARDCEPAVRGAREAAPGRGQLRTRRMSMKGRPAAEAKAAARAPALRPPLLPVAALLSGGWYDSCRCPGALPTLVAALRSGCLVEFEISDTGFDPRGHGLGVLIGQG